jgi:Fe-S oxidoreductase
MLQQHCHEYAVFGASAQRRVLDRLGVGAVHEAVGCCGLAGNFGFEREHYDVSQRVADLALTPALNTAAARVAIAADGFSCQTQIAHLNPEGNPPPTHLAQLLSRALHTRELHDHKGIRI